MARSPSTRGAPTRWSQLRDNAPVLVVVVMSAVIIVAVAVLPFRTWLQQRELLSSTEQQQAELQAEVDDLQAQLDVLQTDDEVERQARENFDLVYPGEESYRIIPAPED